MTAFNQDWVNWAANISSAQASPPRLGIAVHLIMLKSGTVKGLGNFELCETCAHDLFQRLLIRETLERIIHALCGRVHNYAVLANSTRVHRNTPESALPFGLILCFIRQTGLENIAQVHVLLCLSKTRGIMGSRENRH